MKGILTAVLVWLSISYCVAEARLVRVCMDQSVLSYEVNVKTFCSRNSIKLFGKGPGATDFTEVEAYQANGKLNRTVDLGLVGTWEFYLTCYDSCQMKGMVGDTLVGDNSPPEGVRIDSVSVIGDSVVIGWSESISKDVESYILYYDAKGGLTTTLDTVRGDLRYYENEEEVNALNGSVSYRIGARDSCGFSTGPRVPHRTIFLDIAEVDFCGKVVNVERTDYGGWVGDITYKVVYREVGKLVWSELVGFDGKGLEMNLDTILKDIEIKVRAENAFFGYTSSSNTRVLLFSEKRELDTLYITGVDNYSDSVVVKLRSTKTDLVREFELEFTKNPDMEFWSKGRKILSNGLGRQEIVLDESVAGMYYRVKAISSCEEDLGYSNMGRVLELTVKTPESLRGAEFNKELEKVREMSWTDYRQWTGGGTKYAIERKTIDGWEEIEGVSDLNYSDLDVLPLGVDSGICYRVIARELVPVISSDTGASRTNEICVFFDFHKALPTSFIPSENADILFEVPIEGLDTTGSYMKVFNRWGQMVYDGGLGWNGGRMNDASQPCQAGMYMYTMRVQFKNGVFYFVSERVDVIR